jgi:hypothetical protein
MKYFFSFIVFLIIMVIGLSFFFHNQQVNLETYLMSATSPVVVIAVKNNPDLTGKCKALLEDGDGNYITMRDSVLCGVKSGQIIKR